jgi:hypothetical protein
LSTAFYLTRLSQQPGFPRPLSICIPVRSGGAILEVKDSNKSGEETFPLDVLNWEIVVSENEIEYFSISQDLSATSSKGNYPPTALIPRCHIENLTKVLP